MTARAVSAGGASLPDPGATRPADARITVHAPELAAVTRIQELALAHITVQPMPGGRFLVAGAGRDQGCGSSAELALLRRSAAACPARGPERASSSRRRQAATGEGGVQA